MGIVAANIATTLQEIVSAAGEAGAHNPPTFRLTRRLLLTRRCPPLPPAYPPTHLPARILPPTHAHTHMHAKALTMTMTMTITAKTMSTVKKVNPDLDKAKRRAWRLHDRVVQPTTML